MGKSSKKRSRAPDEEAAGEENEDGHVASASASAAERAVRAVKKSKLDESGKAEVTRNGTDESPAKQKKDRKNRTDEKEKKKDKKDSRKKDKKSNDEVGDVPVQNGMSATHEPTQVEVEAAADKNEIKKKSTKDKKDTKDKKKRNKEDLSEVNGDTNGDVDDAAKLEGEGEEADANAGAGEKGKQTRFICFIGNLPYTATADAVRAHFATIHPTNVRLLTQREDPTRSRGIAFVEFGRYDHMKTCLEKFHHTEFDDGLSPARKINVELT